MGNLSIKLFIIFILNSLKKGKSNTSISQNLFSCRAKQVSELEEPVYDLGDHPDFNFRPGTIVIRIAGGVHGSDKKDDTKDDKKDDEKDDEKAATPMEDEEEFHSADDGEGADDETKDKAAADSWCHTGQVLDNGLDGTLRLKWADGTEGSCQPTDLYRVKVKVCKACPQTVRIFNRFHCFPRTQLAFFFRSASTTATTTAS